VIPYPVSNLLYDIIEAIKSKKMPLRLQTGRISKKKKRGIEFAVLPKSHENLRPLLSVNWVPVISHLVLNLLYDIIEVMKSKILPLRLQTGFRLVRTHKGKFLAL
jgi:hypothetical protein